MPSSPLLACAAPAVRGVAAARRQTEAAREGYVPVKDLPAAEQLPAAPLVLGAYAVIWLGGVRATCGASRGGWRPSKPGAATLRRMIETRQ